MNNTPTSGTTADEAARWYVRVQVDPGARRLLDAWLASEPAHAAAWKRVASADQALAELSASPRLQAMLAEARVPVTGRGNRHARLAIAASVLLSIGGASLFAFHEKDAGRPARATTLASTTVWKTAVGQRRTVALADGSRITLDTDTRLDVSMGGAERRVRLAGGRALFAVAKDAARPFIVSAGANSVTALGTRFAVRSEGGRMSVTLEQGKVRVETPAAHRATILHPGSTLVAQGDAVTVAATSARERDWQDGYIRFDAVPLAAAVDEMNRYAVRKIVLADARLASVPVSGVFRTDGGQAFAHALTEYKIARVDEHDPARLVLRPF